MNGNNFSIDETKFDRFRHLIKVSDKGCWEWQAKIDKYGYPVIKLDGRSVGAHRYGCELGNGPPPPNSDASHLCANSICVSPNHLIWESHLDNVRRIEFTHCKKGHEYVPGSWRYNNQRQKTCKICLKEKLSRKRN